MEAWKGAVPPGSGPALAGGLGPSDRLGRGRPQERSLSSRTQPELPGRQKKCADPATQGPAGPRGGQSHTAASRPGPQGPPRRFVVLGPVRQLSTKRAAPPNPRGADGASMGPAAARGPAERRVRQLGRRPSRFPLRLSTADARGAQAADQVLLLRREALDRVRREAQQLVAVVELDRFASGALGRGRPGGGHAGAAGQV
jgi:hypothetical protein